MSRARALLGFGLALLLASAARAQQPTVQLIELDGSISPATADFVSRAVAEAAAAGANALVIQLDTPGGAVFATQDIVSSILNAPLPVIVYVAPRGAFAASAGTFITMAGHVAAMAPGTSIGAAHPVFMTPFGTPPQPPAPEDSEDEDAEPPPPAGDVMGQKIENLLAAFAESIAEERDRNVEWAIDAVRNSVAITHTQAVELNVVDLIAEDLPHLLELAHGREVRVGRTPVALETDGVPVVTIEMTGLDRFYSMIAEPGVAFLLLLGGLLGLYLEFNQPGTFVPGILGAICLLLAAFAFQVIPFNWVGLVVILVGLGLMVAEIFVVSFGVLFGTGVACLALGGYLLFDVPELTDVTVPFLTVILPTVIGFALFGAIIVFGVSRSFMRRQVAGHEGMVGAEALADSDLDPSGRVFVHGEYWNAEATEPVQAGARVRVLEVRDLVLRVAPATDAGGEH